MSARRYQSQTERDLSGMQARKERAGTSPAIPDELPEDITGQYEGEELAMMRSRRDTHDRIARVEIKQDQHGLAIAEIRGGIQEQLRYLKRADDREAAKEAARELAVQHAENRRAMWRKLLPKIITALGVAIAGIIAATH